MRTVPTRQERKARTRSDLVDAAERLFTGQGFHATSLDAIAEAAGYTKGAVYSNFDSKEDLFFAVYERRVTASVEDLNARFDGEADYPAVVQELARETAARRSHDDGWLAVFFEFWTHVLRHPELRERFAQLHAAAIEPLATALGEHAERDGFELPDDPRKLATAFYAMQLGLSLERLTQPDVVDPTLGARMARLTLEEMSQ